MCHFLIIIQLRILEYYLCLFLKLKKNRKLQNKGMPNFNRLGIPGSVLVLFVLHFIFLLLISPRRKTTTIICLFGGAKQCDKA